MAIETMELLRGSEIPVEYLTDQVTGKTGHAYGVVFPTSEAEVLKWVHFAEEEGLAVIVRGGGTGLTGATLPVAGELILDLTKMDKIRSFDEATLTLVVEPGVTLGAIQAFAEAQGYFYPPDPGSKEATIGGTVATNAGGMRAVKYGVTRDYVKALRVVLLSGEVLSLGGVTAKNSSGYDLKNLFIGSEGTLGITTEISLKLIVPPQVKRSLLVSFAELSELSQAVIEILRSGVTPTALEFFEQEGINYSERLLEERLPLTDGQVYLLLTLDDADEGILQEKQAVVAQVLREAAQTVQVLAEEEAQSAWRLRDAMLTGIKEVSEQEPLDIVVPINYVPQAVAYVKQLGAAHELETICFGHAGDGNIHACVLRRDYPEPVWEEKLDAFLTALYQYIAGIKGLPSAEHGIGLQKKKYFLRELDPALLGVMRQIKQVFDPDQRLNPTKVL